MTKPHKDINHVITSLNAGKASFKIQYPFMNTAREAGRQVAYLNILMEI